jgi:anti-sigma regulatory factor (Ser/Thr protein kinase)
VRASDPTPPSRLITPGTPGTRRTPPRETGVLTFIVPADGEQLPLVRHRVGAWLAGHRVRVELRRDVVTAVDEAVSRSIRHGYREGDDDGLVAITVHANADDIVVLVADHGSWPSTPDSRGLGLAVIEGLAEQVDLTRDTGRTTLTARFARPHRATAWAPEQRTAAATGTDEPARTR